LEPELKTGPGASAPTAAVPAIDPTRDRFAGAREWAKTRPPLDITGVNARIVWGRYGGDPAATQGYDAAAVHGFVVTHRKGTPNLWSLRCVVAKVDAFNLRQRPLYLVVPFENKRKQKGVWVWEIGRFDLHAQTINADLVFAPSRRK